MHFFEFQYGHGWTLKWVLPWRLQLLRIELPEASATVSISWRMASTSGCLPVTSAVAADLATWIIFSVQLEPRPRGIRPSRLAAPLLLLRIDLPVASATGSISWRLASTSGCLPVTSASVADLSTWAVQRLGPHSCCDLLLLLETL